MRNRKIQRELQRRGIQKPEKMDLRDGCGMKDPTPYLANHRMIEERKELIRQLKKEYARNGKETE